MPLNFYGSQTVTPTNAMVAQQTYSDPLATVHSSANFYQTNELENFVPSYSTHTYSTPPVPPRSTMLFIGPITDEMFDRYVQRWKDRQRPIRPTHQTGQTGAPQPVRPVVPTGLTGSPHHTVPNQ